MSKKMPVGKAIKFNPSESIINGSIAKKIPMGVLTEFQRKISGFEYSEYNNGPKFRNGDTVVAKITPCLENGKTAFVDILDDNEIAFGSSEFIVLRKTEYTVSEFIYYFARSPLFRERAINCMEGTSGRKRVNENTLKNLEFVFPDLTTQKSIAKVLSDLDTKIELNNRINRELEAMAKMLYDYWFVQFDFPNPSTSSGQAGKPYKSSGGKMVYNAELKREIPEGWEAGNLEDIGTIIGGSTPSKENSEYFSYRESTPWITPKDLSMNKGNKFITRGEFDVTLSGIKTASLKIMPKGTVLLSSRAPIGYLAISREKVTTNQGFKSFVPDKGFSTYFIFYTVQKMIPTIINNAVGSTFKEVSGTTLKSIKIPIPVKSILKVFDEKLSSIFKRQDLLELENQQLSELRDWLLPRLMNGQVVSTGSTTLKEAEERLNSSTVRPLCGVEGSRSMAAEPQEKYNTKSN